MTLAAREAARRLQDVRAEAWTSNGLGIAYTVLGDTAAARHCFAAALAILAITRRLEDRQGESITLNNLGKALHSLGRRAEALHTQQEALAVARGVGDRHCEAEILGDIAEVRRALGDRAGASRDYERCEQFLHDRLGDSVGALTAVLSRAEMAAAAGETAAAARLARTAAAHLDGIDEPDARSLRTRLMALQRSGPDEAVRTDEEPTRSTR